MTYPRQQAGQSFDDHQADMARWMGTTVAGMNDHHDALHAALTDWLGIPSHALRQARGEDMTAHEYHLAAIEEDAVLYVQRLICLTGARTPCS